MPNTQEKKQIQYVEGETKVFLGVIPVARLTPPEKKLLTGLFGAITMAGILIPGGETLATLSTLAMVGVACGPEARVKGEGDTPPGTNKANPNPVV